MVWASRSCPSMLSSVRPRDCTESHAISARQVNVLPERDRTSSEVSALMLKGTKLSRRVLAQEIKMFNLQKLWTNFHGKYLALRLISEHAHIEPKEFACTNISTDLGAIHQPQLARRRINQSDCDALASRRLALCNNPEVQQPTEIL